MFSIWDVPFIVTDVETSGSNPVTNRIIEISCVTVQSGEIVSEFSSLVNPHQFIPEFIQKMTGIKNEIAFNAPEPEEVFPMISKLMTEANVVFVAHNVKFDWSFVKQSLIREKLPAPELEKICTLKLARRLLQPDLKKNLGSLSHYFNIIIKNRHRASGDALATAKVLIELLELVEKEFNVNTLQDLLNFQNRPLKQATPKFNNFESLGPVLASIPNEPGVYYFKDKKENILYIGKAKSLKDRVSSYFRNDFFRTKKISKMLKQIADIHWECTDTELAAMILESREIKRLLPPYNTMDKNYTTHPFIKITTNEFFPRLEITYTINEDGSEYFGPFRSSFLIKSIIESVNKIFKLRKCEKNINPGLSNKPCFYYHIKKCYSPCSQLEVADEYNAEVEKVKNYLGGFSNGVIEQLENRMETLAEEMKFEKAALLRNNIFELQRVLERHDKVPTSINKNNIIIILPVSSREKTIEMFFIKTGKLVFQSTIGRKSPLNSFSDLIHNTYFNNHDSILKFEPDDINELKIITSWVHRNRENSVYIYIEGKSEEVILDEFENRIRNITFPDEEQILSDNP
jgi:DNA polymerase III subunit epsilon